MVDGVPICAERAVGDVIASGFLCTKGMDGIAVCKTTPDDLPEALLPGRANTHATTVLSGFLVADKAHACDAVKTWAILTRFLDVIETNVGIDLGHVYPFLGFGGSVSDFPAPSQQYFFPLNWDSLSFLNHSISALAGSPYGVLYKVIMSSILSSSQYFSA